MPWVLWYVEYLNIILPFSSLLFLPLSSFPSILSFLSFPFQFRFVPSWRIPLFTILRNYMSSATTVINHGTNNANANSVIWIYNLEDVRSSESQRPYSASTKENFINKSPTIMEWNNIISYTWYFLINPSIYPELQACIIVDKTSASNPLFVSKNTLSIIYKSRPEVLSLVPLHSPPNSVRCSTK